MSDNVEQPVYAIMQAYVLQGMMSEYYRLYPSKFLELLDEVLCD